MTKKRGLLIVFEGLDRSGKSTQCELLNKYLQGPSKLIKFPNRETCIGKTINEFLKGNVSLEDHSIHLLFSANRWENMEEMKQNLNNGITLIVDRYSFSGVAFSAAKGLDFDWCKTCDKGLLSPDIVFFIDVDPNIVSSQRHGFGDEIYEKVEFQTKVLSQFRKFEKEPCWNIINGNRPIEEVSLEIFKIVGKYFDILGSTPVHSTLFQ